MDRDGGAPALRPRLLNRSGLRARFVPVQPQEAKWCSHAGQPLHERPFQLRQLRRRCSSFHPCGHRRTRTRSWLGEIVERSIGAAEILTRCKAGHPVTDLVDDACVVAPFPWMAATHVLRGGAGPVLPRADVVARKAASARAARSR